MLDLMPGPVRITGEEPTLLVTPDASTTPSSTSPVASTPARHVLAGRYEILGLVGSGGMGTVYRARDKELDEVVALKLLRRDVLHDSGMLERFRQEVKLARRVTHRNVARTFDIGESDGEKFLTMELVDGEGLGTLLSREGALPLDRVVTIADGICAGLQAAHAAGIIHRDLKPDNVLLARDGRVVLTDFGIARVLSDAGRAVTVGLALGTPAYMAPEQVEGASDLDARVDVYALGGILYECMTGERAWTGDSIWSLAAARLMQPPPDPRSRRPDLPEAAAQLVLRCMARKRDERFASAAEVASALASLTVPPAAAPRPSVPPVAALESDAKTVAVLPLLNAGAAEDDYLAEGLSDDLIDALSMTPGLRVLARGAVARFRQTKRDAREAGRELRVHVVVDGSVRRAGDTVRVTVRVVSVADGFQLWAKRFDRPDTEVLAVSDQAADAIADALTLRRQAPARVPPSDARALDLYLRARHAFRSGWRDDVARSIVLFEHALALAPEDPTILAGYARAELRRFVFDTEASGARDAERKGREAAEKALRIAPGMGEPWAALANLKWVMGDAVGCARDLREAIRIAPSSGDVNELAGRLLLEAGAPERGIAMLAAAETMEPGMDLASGDLVRGRALLGDWSGFEDAVDTPTWEGEGGARFFLLARLAMWRRDATAAEAVRRRVEPKTFPLRAEVLSVLDMIARGRTPHEMQAVLTDWGRVVGRARRRPMFFRQLAAEGLAFNGELDEALQAVNDADALGLIDVTWLDRCPLLEGLRAVPAFAATRDRVAARAKEAVDALEGKT
jgi:eukaryotic-like serine/threonine-protein kinase